MSPSTNTQYIPTSSITKLVIVPPNSPYITQSDLDNTFKYIHTNIKAYIKAINYKITALLAKLNDRYYKKIEKQIQPKSLHIIELSSTKIESIENEVVTITYEHPSSEDKFERK